MQQLTHTAIRTGDIERVRACVTRMIKTTENDKAVYTLHLDDGRCVKAQTVVLATGNLPPAPPKIRSSGGRWLQDMSAYVPDPWAPGSLEVITPETSVLLIGTGLTMVDVALTLKARGHWGPLIALSRRGLSPQSHEAGGKWALSLPGLETPLEFLKRLRGEARAAAAQGVPWQRVIDTARPHGAQIWSAWNRYQKKQFLRHLRPWWDHHRHRLAPRVSTKFEALRASGELTLLTGRLIDFERMGEKLQVRFRPRHTSEPKTIEVGYVINCTGPRSDYASEGLPLFADLKAQGLIHANHLGLGLETSDARVIDSYGRVSETLFAIGPLTRPEWWEVTAVPEITVQVGRLARHLAGLLEEDDPCGANLATDFYDLGAGI